MKINHNISAALIVKDSSLTIAETINSIKPVCNQIVVVDTGSTDDTTKICTRMGAEVYYFKWQNDFSLARNYALNFVRANWVLIIDSDEILLTDSLKNNEHLFDDPSVGGIRVIIKNYIKDTNTVKDHTYPRLFRNYKKLRFTGKIHEQISESILNEGYDIIDSNITIHHFGYSQNDEEKINRNLNLLEQEVLENPADDWKVYHLAETEFTAGNFDTAFKLFYQVLNSVLLSEEQNDMVKIRLGQLLLRDNKFDEAELMLNFTASTLQLEGLRQYVLASTLIMTRKISIAEELLNSFEVKQSELINKHDLSNVLSLLEKIKEQIALI